MIFALFGPSGSGKTTLEKAVVEKLIGFKPLVSTTTRTPRFGEIRGADYHFVSPEAFKALEADGALVEAVFFNGNNYGLTLAEVENKLWSSRHQVVTLNIQGLTQLKALCPGNVCAVFLKPPTPEAAVSRMIARGTTSSEIEARAAEDAELWAAESLADHVIETVEPAHTFEAFLRLVADTSAAA
jgi:guanylate kinase